MYHAVRGEQFMTAAKPCCKRYELPVPEPRTSTSEKLSLVAVDQVTTNPAAALSFATWNEQAQAP